MEFLTEKRLALWSVILLLIVLGAAAQARAAGALPFDF